MKVYLAGPMTGIAQFNFPQFFAVRDELVRGGVWDVVLPGDMDDPDTIRRAMASPDGRQSGTEQGLRTWGQCLGKDVEIIADQVEGIIFLPGWERSRGARLEAMTGLLCDRHFFIYLQLFHDDIPCGTEVARVPREYIKAKLLENT